MANGLKVEDAKQTSSFDDLLFLGMKLLSLSVGGAVLFPLCIWSAFGNWSD